MALYAALDRILSIFTLTAHADDRFPNYFNNKAILDSILKYNSRLALNLGRLFP